MSFINILLNCVAQLRCLGFASFTVRKTLSPISPATVRIGRLLLVAFLSFERNLQSSLSPARSRQADHRENTTRRHTSHKWKYCFLFLEAFRQGSRYVVVLNKKESPALLVEIHLRMMLYDHHTILRTIYLLQARPQKRVREQL